MRGNDERTMMTHRHLLSTTGSDRATAYNMSNKIVRRDGRLFVGWLDSPAQAGRPAPIQLGVGDAATGEMRRLFTIGAGTDNHCGPALALDGKGRLHAIIGAHHGPFLHRWSDRPDDPASWSEPIPLGPLDTYPSLAVDRDGTLHLAHRERGERWALWYRRQRHGRSWETARALAVSPTPGYNHYMQSLSVGPDGRTLHLTFQFHYAASGRAIDCQGYAAVYMRSEDGGETWFNEGVRCDQLPLTIETAHAICHQPAGGLRVGNHVIDAQDRPWLFIQLPDTPGGALWHRDEKGWTRQNLALNGLNTLGGRATSLSRAGSGRLHLALAADPDGRETAWFDPRLELFHLVLTADGAPMHLRQLTVADPQTARWLPALEGWDWTRPEACCADGLWMGYTQGLNAGGIGGDNRNTINSQVYLCKLGDSVS